MSVYVADVETDGLLHDMTKIHCIVAKDYNTKEVFRFRPNNIRDGVALLQEAEELVFHNGIGFDIPAIKKLYPYFNPKGKITDTLVEARTIYSNLREMDFNIITKSNGYLKSDTFVIWDRKKKCYKSAVGSHALAAWGQRMQVLKGDFGETANWKEFTEAMLDYCLQDVVVTEELHRRILKKNYSQEALALEALIASIVEGQMSYGVLFDKANGVNLYTQLVEDRRVLTNQLQTIFTGWYEDMKTPEYYYSDITDMFGTTRYQAPTKGELQDELYRVLKPAGYTRQSVNDVITAGELKRKYYPFNPGSLDDKIKVLKEKYNWKPEVFNKDKEGKINKDSPKLDTDVLEKLPYLEAKLFIDYDVLQDRLEKLHEGKNGGYLDFMDNNNRIHGYINPLGTNTHRCTHSSPNISQVPASYSPYGKEFRSLFIVPKGYKLVGSDMSGIEMCCMAHYLYEWDNGIYADAVSKGDKKLGTDAHSLNMKAMGLNDRDTAKTAYYALIYGAGFDKLGKITGKDGKSIKQNLLDGIIGFRELVERCSDSHNDLGYVIGLDGRKLYTRSSHSALNVLLQSAGAILAKRWILTIHSKLNSLGISDHAKQVLWVHDEVAMEVKEGYEEQVSNVMVNSMKDVEMFYKFRCPLSANAAIGTSWYDVH